MAENRLLSIGLALLLLTVSLGLGWLAGRLFEAGSAPTVNEAALPPPPTIPPGSAPARMVGGPRTPGATATVRPTRPAPGGAPAAAGPMSTPTPSPQTSPPPPAARATPIVLGQSEVVSPAPARRPLHIVQVAVVETREEAQALMVRLRGLGFAPYLVATREGFAVRLGAFRRAAHAAALVRRAEAAGVSVTVIVRP
ncbi:MAG: SPOR domain-containing protein [Armatimonadota bacterium]|nr:SPOR domain-containing protein [Armatimonadota bacterium]MDR7449327.1 SPOR domain-containing protein [Armatimonadota bacterium]MDR7458774.1 SPOR domain-containing protein [Armatimonadota bacterium]MDR7479992.1 SPOR domain-containing protein [Armatimonadota bacterium]MDR7488618.1 SPOR domain-containing protein [Armatimonadota bacterium]